MARTVRATPTQRESALALNDFCVNNLGERMLVLGLSGSTNDGLRPRWVLLGDSGDNDEGRRIDNNDGDACADDLRWLRGGTWLESVLATLIEDIRRVFGEEGERPGVPLPGDSKLLLLGVVLLLLLLLLLTARDEMNELDEECLFIGLFGSVW